MPPGPGRENGRGRFQRYRLDRFGCEYLGGPGQVKASAWGAEAALVFTVRPAQSRFTVSLKAGYRFQDDDYDGASAGP